MIALGTPEKALSSSGFEFLQNQEKQVESGLLNDYQSVTGVPQHAHNIPQEKLGDLQVLFCLFIPSSSLSPPSHLQEVVSYPFTNLLCLVVAFGRSFEFTVLPSRESTIGSTCISFLYSFMETEKKSKGSLFSILHVPSQPKLFLHGSFRADKGDSNFRYSYPCFGYMRKSRPGCPCALQLIH